MHTPKQLSIESALPLLLAENQQHVKNGATLACIPCGSMKELLQLDYTDIDTIRLIGIDPDFDKIKYAQALSESRQLCRYTNLILADASELDFCNEFDLISCSTLDLIGTQQDKILTIYRLFYQALKPKGTLAIVATSNTQELLKSAGFTQIHLHLDSTPKNALIIAYK
jgi:Methyltransferase domain.